MSLINNILFGLFFICIGIWLIYLTYNYDEDLKNSKALSFLHWKGYVAGGALILIGIAQSLGYLKW